MYFQMVDAQLYAPYKQNKSILTSIKVISTDQKMNLKKIIWKTGTTNVFS